MFESHPIAGRLAVIAILSTVLGSSFYLLTGESVVVGESHADVVRSEPAADPSPVQPAVVRRGLKGDRLAVASVFGTGSADVFGPAIVDFFKAAFDTGLRPSERSRATAIARRIDTMGAILQAAALTDVDPVYLIALADKESNLRPGREATSSSAAGLFQFVDGTWLELVGRFGADHGLAKEARLIRTVDGQPVVADEAARRRILALRDDPYLSAVMAGEMARRDRQLLMRRTGRDLSAAESYMAHFLGRGGASKFIQMLKASPHENAAAAFPAAAQANPTIFYVKVGDERKGLTVAQVFDRLERAIDSRVARYTGVGATTALLAEIARDPTSGSPTPNPGLAYTQ